MKEKLKYVLPAIVALIVIVMIPLSIVRVPAGHTGVVTTFGRVENVTLDSGMHLKSPWQSVIKMDNRIQKQTVNLSAFSKDIQEVNMVYTVNYQISKKDASTIYSTIGKEYYETVIAPSVMEAVKTVAAKYTAEELITDRPKLAVGIEEELSKVLPAVRIDAPSHELFLETHLVCGIARGGCAGHEFSLFQLHGLSEGGSVEGPGYPGGTNAQGLSIKHHGLEGIAKGLLSMGLQLHFSCNKAVCTGDNSGGEALGLGIQKPPADGQSIGVFQSVHVLQYPVCIFFAKGSAIEGPDASSGFYGLH